METEEKKIIVYRKTIKKRIILLYSTIGVLIVFTAALVLYGAGDSRVVSPQNISFGSCVLFFSFIYLIWKASFYSRLLQNNDFNELYTEMISEQDEYRIWLYEHSGGDIFTCIFIIVLLVNVTCALFSTPAFNASLVILSGMVLMKIIFYLYYRFHGTKDHIENRVR